MDDEKPRQGKPGAAKEAARMRETSETKLTAKQAAFIREYLIDLNATQAAIRAGYSIATAKQIGQENLTKPDIASAIQRSMTRRSRVTDVTAERVVKELAKIAFSDMQDFVVVEQPEESDTEEVVDGKKIRTIIRRQGITIRPSEEVDGAVLSEVSEGKDGLKIKLHDKMKALELLGRHLAMFTDRVEATGKDGGKLAFEIFLQNTAAAQPGTIAEAPSGYGAGAPGFLPPNPADGSERSTAAPEPADGRELPPERDTGAGVDCSAAGTNEDDDDGDSDE